MLTILKRIRYYISKYAIYKYYYNKYSKYEYLSEKHKNLLFYEKLFEKVSNTNTIHTTQDVSFRKKLKFNDSKSKIKKVLGNPAYEITNTENKDIEILFYKIQIGQEKIRCEVHLYRNKLFLFTYQLTYIKHKNSQLMLSILKKNYKVNHHDIFSNRISDKSDNSLMVSKHIGINLTYVNLTHSFFTFLKSHLSEKEHYTEKLHSQLERFYKSL